MQGKNVNFLIEGKDLQICIVRQLLFSDHLPKSQKSFPLSEVL